MKLSRNLEEDQRTQNIFTKEENVKKYKLNRQQANQLRSQNFQTCKYRNQGNDSIVQIL